MSKLTATQINVLSGAAQRDDGAAMLPEQRKPGSVAKLSQAPIAQKLVREVQTKSRMPTWRRLSLGIEVPENRVFAPSLQCLWAMIERGYEMS